MGLVMDGWNSVIRYFKNNFSDGFRQVGVTQYSHNYKYDVLHGTIFSFLLYLQGEFCDLID